MFFRLALALALGATLGCGAPSTKVGRPVRTPDMQRIGELGYAARAPAGARSMELWVRLGAFDASPPQRATALAWSFETEALKASVFPFSTRFTWSCGPDEPFSSCAERGLSVLQGAPERYDVEAIRARLAAGRLAAASSNPDAREALDALLRELFEEPSKLRPLGKEPDDVTLSEAALAALWERYYGANNALLVSYGYDVEAHVGLSTATLRRADDRFLQPDLALGEGQVRSGEASPGYRWTAALCSCFEAVAQLRAAFLKLEPRLISHLIDVRGHGYLAVFLGPAPEPEHGDFLRTMVSSSQCQTKDPLMRWLIGELGLDTTR